MNNAAAICVVEYEPGQREVWNNFVSGSVNGTVFHNQDFLAYHPADRFDFCHLMFYDGGTLVAVLPGAVKGTTYVSPAGASFGGFVFAHYLALQGADRIVKGFVGWCRDAGIEQARLVPPMQVYQRTFDEVMEYALIYNGFVVGNPLFSSVIDLQQICSKADMSRNTRHKINKAAKKGVQIVESDDYGAFYPILLENKAKFGVKPTHTLEELHTIAKNMPGMMTLFLALVDNKPVAGELLFSVNKQCVLNFYTMHLYEYHNYFAVNSIVEHAVRWSVEKGFRYYDYGVSADTASTNPLEPSWPLVFFKESMGSCGCIRKSYQLNLSVV